MPQSVFYSIRPLAPAFLAACFLVTGCGKDAAPPAPPSPVSVTKVQSQAVPFELAATGQVEPLQTVVVTAQVGGLLQHVRFREGDEVQQGQILFEIDPRPFQAMLQQAAASLNRDIVQLANAVREADRASALATNGMGTTEDAQSKEAARDALLATVQSDSASMTTARLNLDYATIRAPISGRTGSLLVKEGNLVVTSAVQPLVTINELRPILVRFAVPAARLPEIQQRGNAELKVVARQGGREGAPPIDGVLSFIDNHVDSATGTVMLKARYSNTQGGLWPGEFVDVTLVLGMQQNAIVVPATAVMTGQQGPYVFTVESDGTAKQRLVKVARTEDTLAVIGDGVEPGMTVVTDGQIRLTQGAHVEVRGAAHPGGTTTLGAQAPAAGAPRGGRNSP
ncbi:MAG TPA: efflux RND transporter periplasmic adaptor subunit [Gemmatimonadales bacterium]|jgi:multidrug efflux system membrane fusion protein